MKRIILTAVLVLVLLMPAVCVAGDYGAFKPRAVTKPGHVDLIDIELEVVTIEGKDYRIHEDVVVRKQGEDCDIRIVSAGDFVIASIRDDVVTKMTVIPPGRGF